MATNTVDSGRTGTRRETDGSERRVQYLPPAGHDTVAAVEAAYERQGGLCAACGDGVSREESVHEHIYTNDFSTRSAVAVCPDCRDRDEWRGDVRDRRVDDAGHARGWIIQRLWGYSTQSIRAAALAAVMALLTVAGAIGVAASGGLSVAIRVVTASPAIALAIGSGLAVACIAAWHRLDTRGYVVRERPPWYTLAAVSGGLIGLTVVGLPPIPADVAAGPVVTALWSITVPVLCGALVISVALFAGTTVRADEAKGTLILNRTAVVGSVWVGVFVALGALAGWLPGSGRIPLLTATPGVIAAAYLVVRAPHDTRLRDQCAMIYDEADDLLFGGPW